MPNPRGANAYVAWPMATISATTRGTSSLLNSFCATSGGSDVALPMPDPNSQYSEQDQNPLRIARREQQQGTDQLYGIPGAGHDAAIGARWHQVGDQVTTGNRAGCGEAHRQSRTLRAQGGYQKREQMRDQADLCEQAQRHAHRQCEELSVAPQLSSGQRITWCRCAARRRHVSFATVRSLTQHLRRLREHAVRKHGYVGRHHDADDARCDGESRHRDQRDPERGKDHAANTGPVVGHRQRFWPPA